MRNQTQNNICADLSHFGDSLSDLIEVTSNITSLKDARTGKYLRANQQMAKLHGLQCSNAIIGLTVDDFCQTQSEFFRTGFSHAFQRWKKVQPDKFKILDCKVLSEKRRVESKHVQFTFDGFIFIEKQTKIPIPSCNGQKIIAILSYGEDQTLQYGLSNLFELYRNYFPEKQAIQQILKYLKIDGYFEKWPTLAEMWLLFALHWDVRQKCVANLLGRVNN